jgi:hypothetical protein
MLYHQHSLRRLVHTPFRYLRDRISRTRRRYSSLNETARAHYDSNAQGEAAPHTDFVSRRQIRSVLFRNFARVRIDSQNFDTYVFLRGRIVIHREWLLSTLGRAVGTDLYIVATK